MPDVLGGALDPTHAVVQLDDHLRTTTLLAGRVLRIEHAARTAHIELPDGQQVERTYDHLVLTTGAVRRTPDPYDPCRDAIQLECVADAADLRHQVLSSLTTAAGLPPGPPRDKLLTLTLVDAAGYGGLALFSELVDLAHHVARQLPGLSDDDVNLHFVQSSPRVVPRLSPRASDRVVGILERRGATVHLDDAVDAWTEDHIELESGQRWDAGLVMARAAMVANPLARDHSDLPVSRRGLVLVRRDLRVGSDEHPLANAWAAGDSAAVPDLNEHGDLMHAVWNADHARRQGRRLADNLVRMLRGRAPRPYRYRWWGTVVRLGRRTAVLERGRLVLSGLPAWCIHLGHHVCSAPTWRSRRRLVLPRPATGPGIVAGTHVSGPTSTSRLDIPGAHDESAAGFSTLLD
jgi:NADH:ubiquinone reductase (H+-translocating)